MARFAMKVIRKPTWGVLSYDTLRPAFTCIERQPRASEPYADQPVVLNIVVTRRCNMDCDYCVAKDFAGVEQEDLVLSQEMIRWLNSSPFMVLVLTGGEPLLPPYDAVSLQLIALVKNRGVILDTNGTLMPNRNALSQLRERRVMIRVSMDSVNPDWEIKRRQIVRGNKAKNLSAYLVKVANIERFISSGICTAVQTVVWQKNSRGLYQMIDWLAERGIKRWYLQRLIPSNRFKNPGPKIALTPEEYYPLVADIAAKARSLGIECVAKMDLRHNSVFLLTADGTLYTQGPSPGQKVRLGTIRERIAYFDYVSAADHACRYYLADPPGKRAAK